MLLIDAGGWGQPVNRTTARREATIGDEREKSDAIEQARRAARDNDVLVLGGDKFCCGVLAGGRLHEPICEQEADEHYVGAGEHPVDCLDRDSTSGR